MTLHYQSIESHVHSLLAEWCNEVSSPSNMTGITDDGQVGEASL